MERGRIKYKVRQIEKGNRKNSERERKREREKERER